MAISNSKTNRPFPADEGYLDEPKDIKMYDVMVIDDKAHKVHTVVVHKFNMGDVDDPELYAAQPIWEWQQTDMGKWVMEKSVQVPMWHRHFDIMSYGHTYAITGYLKDEDYTYWCLKWGTK